MKPLAAEMLVRLKGAIDDGGLDLHGSYIWVNGSRVFGPALGLENSEKEGLVRQALGVLRDDERSSVEKAEAIDEIPGFGPISRPAW